MAVQATPKPQQRHSIRLLVRQLLKRLADPKWSRKERDKYRRRVARVVEMIYNKALKNAEVLIVWEHLRECLSALESQHEDAPEEVAAFARRVGEAVRSKPALKWVQQRLNERLDEAPRDPRYRQSLSALDRESSPEAQRRQRARASKRRGAKLLVQAAGRLLGSIDDVGAQAVFAAAVHDRYCPCGQRIGPPDLIPPEPKRRGRKARDEWWRECHRQFAYAALSDAVRQLVHRLRKCRKWIKAAERLLERAQWEGLTDRQRSLLRVLKYHGAAADDMKLSTQELAEQSRKQEGVEPIRRDEIRRQMANLVRHGLCASTGPGPAAGYWLTPRGYALVSCNDEP